MYHRLTSEDHADENSADESKTENTEFSLAPISGSYGSTSPQDKPAPRFYVPCCGLVFYVMAFLGITCAYCLRECLSVAIVAMVNQTAVADDDFVVTNVTEDQCPRDPELRQEGGEFIWNRNLQGIVLGAFYYGFALTQIPGGWMADSFGGKWLVGGCILLSSAVALLTPTAARVHIVFLIILLVLSGLGEGVMRPAIYALIARWSAPKYRSLVVAVITVGAGVGTMIGMLVSGVLCDYGFAGGWPSVFYVFGMVGCVWSAAWFLLCYSSPATHPRISTVEQKYWETVIGTTDLTAHPPTPWREIFTSVPVWALTVAFFASNWGYYTVAICLPLFMHDVLGFDMTGNGFFSAIPFTSSFTLPVSGFVGDWLRSPGRLSTNVVRKTTCVVGFAFTGIFLILAGYVGCNRALAVAVMFFIVGFTEVGFACAGVNQLDLAPLHAGKIMGLTYTVASLSAFLAPYAVSVLTSSHSTRSEWQRVFFLAAGINAVGALVFAIFGSGERQRWADDTEQIGISSAVDPNK